ncbi:hypothetical protein [Chryseobacterium sp. Leaf201]|uniref:hypothetical protein n=1 Tax=Chryseobacterium sp. Leaf201 TaxID=1735672 RepID=UPI000FF8AA98|nr:hypothetical protein [Chryseobacterium sp. Leaf201]
MKKIILLGGLVFGAFSMTNCTANKTAQANSADDKMIISASGTITHIENGKDGYMATIRDAGGKEYTATISMINLQKSGSIYKRYQVGDAITVKGPSWNDDQGRIYITAEKLN